MSAKIKWLSTAAVAEMLGMARSVFYQQWQQLDGLPPPFQPKIIGKKRPPHPLWDEQKIIEYIDNNSTGTGGKK